MLRCCCAVLYSYSGALCFPPHIPFEHMPRWSYCMRLESASWTASGQLESHHPIHPSALHGAVDCGLDNQPIPSHHYIAAKIIHRVQRETLSFAIIHVSSCRRRLTFAQGVLAVIGSLATLSDAIPAADDESQAELGWRRTVPTS